jgi:hypothetical protein
MTHASGQPTLENLLAALTDAIIEDEQDLDVIVNRYGIPRADVERFIQLIRRLHVVLVGVHPSRRFAHRLRQELLGQPGSCCCHGGVWRASFVKQVKRPLCSNAFAPRLQGES